MFGGKDSRKGIRETLRDFLPEQGEFPCGWKQNCYSYRGCQNKQTCAQRMQVAE